jgi:hypothetical protein
MSSARSSGIHSGPAVMVTGASCSTVIPPVAVSLKASLAGTPFLKGWPFSEARMMRRTKVGPHLRLSCKRTAVGSEKLNSSFSPEANSRTSVLVGPLARIISPKSRGKTPVLASVFQEPPASAAIGKSACTCSEFSAVSCSGVKTYSADSAPPSAVTVAVPLMTPPPGTTRRRARLGGSAFSFESATASAEAHCWL